MRIGLVGCVKQKAAVASPAADLYQSPLFRGRRAYVERTCERWFILSALHGLLNPGDVIEPYDQTLADASRAERRDWSRRVLTQLRDRVGLLAGHEAEVHAGAAYCDHGLTEGLVAAGVAVERPADGLPLGRQLAFYRDAAAGRSSSTERRISTVGGGYEPLGEDLRRHRGSVRALSFAEIEGVIGRELPVSARRHRAWWANDRTHAQARSWLAAGWKLASVDVAAGRVTFERSVRP